MEMTSGAFSTGRVLVGRMKSTCRVDGTTWGLGLLLLEDGLAESWVDQGCDRLVSLDPAVLGMRD